jgi:hypothetical protein
MKARTMQGILTLLAAGVLAIGLANCGGDGGGSSSVNTLTKSVALNSAQENPPVTSTAMGSGAFTVDLDTGAVTGSVTTFGGLTGTVAHIHDGAAGVNGPILVPLTQGPPGTWSVPANSVLTAAQVQSFVAGTLYVNVHSTANPGGETRAQIGRQVFYATLTGAQETPAVTTTSVGNGRFVYDPATAMLSGTVSTNIGATTAAHIHTGAVGVAGPITIPLSGGPSNFTVPADTRLTDAQVQTLLSGNFYANVHTQANPGGEIRGQLFIPARVAAMNGATEVPANTSTATGTCWYYVNPITRAVAGRIETTLQAANAAHAHRAVSGVNGPIVVPMSTPSAGLWVTNPGAAASDEVFASFMKNELYCNVHTTAFPGGEIRGQLSPTQ